MARHTTKVSKRRWKARCRLHRKIPLEAIVDHRLDRWFKFVPVNDWSEFYVVDPDYHVFRARHKWRAQKAVAIWLERI